MRPVLEEVTGWWRSRDTVFYDTVFINEDEYSPPGLGTPPCSSHYLTKIFNGTHLYGGQNPNSLPWGLTPATYLWILDTRPIHHLLRWSGDRIFSTTNTGLFWHSLAHHHSPAWKVIEPSMTRFLSLLRFSHSTGISMGWTLTPQALWSVGGHRPCLQVARHLDYSGWSWERCRK